MAGWIHWVDRIWQRKRSQKITVYGVAFMYVYEYEHGLYPNGWSDGPYGPVVVFFSELVCLNAFVLILDILVITIAARCP